MSRLTVLLCVVSALGVVNVGGCSSGNKRAESGIFAKQVPSHITARIKEGTTKLSAVAPISVEVATDVRNCVIALDLRRFAHNEHIRDRIRSIGPGAIPTISELLESPDDRTREKAADILTCFLTLRGGSREPGYDVVESTLLAVYHRSLVADRSAAVRFACLGPMQMIGQAKSPVPDEVKQALDEALSDPDAGVRKGARVIQQELGLATGATAKRPGGDCRAAGSEW